MQRPNFNETEDDLLKQQAEFLKLRQQEAGTSKIEPPTEIQPKNNILVGNVVEKPSSGFSNVPQFVEDGFPAVFKIDQNAKGSKKKSLFAQKFQAKMLEEEPNQVMDIEENVDANYVEIHQENTAKIDSMSVDEILHEKRTLEATLDPSLLQFIKNRGAKRTKKSEPPSIAPGAQDLSEVEENLGRTLDKKWIDMDVIEPEKLKWIGDIPDAKALEPDQPYSARFDFSGDLQPFNTEVDVTTSLHHHGDEPHRAGYTIQEIYQLSRSTVLQQRIIALTTLGNVIRKTKMGYYDSCFDGALLHKLVESDVFFLLRFAMDDRATSSAAVHCLSELFVNKSDEVCLDRLYNMPGKCKEPYFFVAFEVDKDSDEKELRDDQVIAQDLVRGVLRTDLLVRFGYILNHFDLDQVAVTKILEVVIRVCRHSVESSENVLESSALLDFVFQNVDSSNPMTEAVKLLRVIANSGNLAKKLFEIRKGDFNFIFRNIDVDAPVFKLKLECLNFLSCMMSHGILVENFQEFSPILKRLVLFYVSTVDVDHGRFDFELFSGILSIFNVAASLRGFLEKDVEASLLICLNKWLSQLISGRTWNFSVAKALGSIFHYFVTKFTFRGVTPHDLVLFENDFLKILQNFLESAFTQMSSKLLQYSHIRHFEIVTRDPENLPSLWSVYKNGSDYLKIVQDGSAFPLMPSLVEFILILSDSSSNFSNLCPILLSSYETYTSSILKSFECTSWFAKHEISFLISLLKLQVKCRVPEFLKFAFRLVPFFRTDDERVLEVVDVITSQGNFPEVYRQYAIKDLKAISYHVCETFPRHWMFEPISVAPKDTLKCLTYILENCPELISNVPPNLRFVHLCLVLLNDENVFNSDISMYLERCLENVLQNFSKLDLDTITISEKSFYELYRDLVTEYAGSSYGNPLFAKVITIPMAQKFDASYRKMMWSEFMHALRVINLPKNMENFIPLDIFTNPVETDESLLVLYLNAVSKNVLMESRNGFLYQAAVENVRKFLYSEAKESDLAKLLRGRISLLTNEGLKEMLLRPS